MLLRRLAIAGLVLACAQLASAADPPVFARDMAPLLQAKCSKCHGEKTQKADLNLSTAGGILKGGESGKVIEPGKPDKSLLFEKIHSGEMPPKKEPRLAEAEIERIRQ